MPLPFEVAITHRRYGAFVVGTDGRAPRGSPTTSTIRGTDLQPLTGRELQTLPEGERSSEWLKFFTTADVRTADQANAYPADEIVRDGIVYEVRVVKTQTQIIPHKRVEVVRIREVG